MRRFNREDCETLLASDLPTILIDSVSIWPDHNPDDHLSTLLHEMLDEANQAIAFRDYASAGEIIAMMQTISDRCPTLASIEEAADFFRTTADRLEIEIVETRRRIEEAEGGMSPDRTERIRRTGRVRRQITPLLFAEWRFGKR